MNFLINGVIIMMLGLLTVVSTRKHQLVLENDIRKYFSITTFGFSTGGQLEVNLNDLTFLSKYNGVFGLTLTRTVSDSIAPYMESHQKCLLLADDEREDGSVEIVSFLLDPNTNEVGVNCSKLASTLEIQPISDFNGSANIDVKKPSNTAPKFQNAAHTLVKQKRSIDLHGNADLKNIATTVVLPVSSEKNLTVGNEPIKKPIGSEGNMHVKKAKSASEDARICTHPKLTFKNEVFDHKKRISNLKFVVIVSNENAQGLYTLFFHNCGGYKESAIPVNLSIAITERNGNSYLSAGEIPLPRLYFFMSFIFFVIGSIWLYVVRRKKEEAFKIHYIMALLVFVKSLSLLFHGINFHIIAKDGFPMEAWAVLYYITHLLKGALLFITIVLIGTGWAFIKHILNDKDKKIFIVVIPLQVLANVAKIIMEESEEGNSRYYYWKEVFILVDLVCCGAILFPVVWSIRHLQEASQTDGKAAINLEKLKLFRHFYIMIVCYIYFTRIIVYLLKITVPFQYEWMDEMFREVATLLFFILTGYNFRPTTSNPYFRLPQEEDVEMDEVVTQTRFTESVTKTVRSRDTSAHDENAPTKRESSHEYD